MNFSLNELTEQLQQINYSLSNINFGYKKGLYMDREGVNYITGTITMPVGEHELREFTKRNLKHLLKLCDIYFNDMHDLVFMNDIFNVLISYVPKEGNIDINDIKPKDEYEEFTFKNINSNKFVKLMEGLVRYDDKTLGKAYTSKYPRSREYPDMVNVYRGQHKSALNKQRQIAENINNTNRLKKIKQSDID